MSSTSFRILGISPSLPSGMATRLAALRRRTLARFGSLWLTPEGRLVARLGQPAPASAGTTARAITLALAVLAASPLSAQNQENNGEPPKAKVTALRLSGSNTIGADLMANLLQGFLGEEGWKNIQRVRTADADVYSVIGTPAGSDSYVAIEVEARGSTTAFDGLEKGLCDIGMSSRRAKEGEVTRLSRLGDLTSPSCEHVIALDGLAIFVNTGLPVTTLTKAQIRDIFSGKISDWSEVYPGASGRVNIYARDDKSGTWDTFKSLVLGDAKLAPEARRYEDSRALSDAVASDPTAIGFAGLPFVRSTRAVAVSDGGAALLPTPFTVRTEDYPLSRRLYLYTAAAPSNPLAVKFIRYVRGDDAQKLVARDGFIDQMAQILSSTRLAEGQVPTAPGATARPQSEYERLTVGGERVTLNIRFRTGATEIDNKAVTDLDRLTALFSTPSMRTKKLVLLGFSDDKGAVDVNLRVSEERARAVAKLLQLRGLPVQGVRGFGSENPVASNESADGRERNRRVEIWVKSV